VFNRNCAWLYFWQESFDIDLNISHRL
jgi:hypothetical protein